MVCSFVYTAFLFYLGVKLICSLVEGKPYDEPNYKSIRFKIRVIMAGLNSSITGLGCRRHRYRSTTLEGLNLLLAEVIYKQGLHFKFRMKSMSKSGGLKSFNTSRARRHRSSASTMERALSYLPWSTTLGSLNLVLTKVVYNKKTGIYQFPM